MSKARSLADLISGGATIEASEIADSTITGGKLASDIVINTTGTVTTSQLNLGDNETAYFGTGNDLAIYHDGSQSIIEDVGTGQLKILAENTMFFGSATGTETYMKAVKNGVVELYYNNDKKFYTHTAGANIDGRLRIDSISGSSNSGRLELYNTDHSSSYEIYNNTVGDLIFSISGTGGAEMSLDADHSNYLNTKLSVGGREVATTTGTQTLSNKTLTSPTITGTGSIAGTFTGNITGDVTGNADTATTLETARTIAGQSFDGTANITIASTDLSNTSDIVLLTSTQTLTNKTLTSPVISTISNTGTLTLPTSTDTLVGRDTTDTLTNKTLTSPAFSGTATNFTSTGIDDNATSTAITIDSSQNVGIGTSSPTKPLHVNSGITNTVVFFESTDNNANIALQDSNGGALLGTGDTGQLKFYTGYDATFSGGSEVMRIDSSGNVGIGTSSPSGKLDVLDSTGSLSATNDITAEFHRNDGTYNPRLQIRHSTTGTDLHHTYSSGASNLTFSIGGVERMRLTSSSLLIGKTSNGVTDIGVEARGIGLLAVGRESNPPGYFTRKTTDGSIIQFYKDTSLVGSIQTSSNELSLSSGNSGNTHLHIDSSGNVGIGTSSPSEILEVSGNIKASGTIESIAPERHSIRPSLNLDFANSKVLDPRITFTRASNATYYDGYTSVKAEENLVTNTSTFGVGRGSITSTSITAPDGTSTAIEFTQDIAETIAGFIDPPGNVYWRVGSTYTYSVFAKIKSGSTLDGVRLSAFSSGKSGTEAYFDLSTGTLFSAGAGVDATSITNYGNGWYRCSMTITASANAIASNGLIHYPTENNSTTVTGGNAIFFWGPQIENRSFATNFISTTGSAITKYQPALQTAGNNVARFDHNPTTGESLGLLIEESRTNLSLYSETYTPSTHWSTNSAMAVINDYAIAPDGTQTAILAYPTGSTGRHELYKRDTLSNASLTHTVSFFAKQISDLRYLRVPVANGGSANLGYVDLQEGIAVWDGTNSGSASITDAGNGWWRISFTFVPDSTNTGTRNNQLYISPGITSPIGIAVYSNVPGDVFRGILVWGFQMEQASFPTSYIKTTSSQVTRSRDRALISDIKNSDWYNPNSSTLYQECTMSSPVDAGYSRIGATLYHSLTPATNDIGLIYYGATATGRVGPNMRTDGQSQVGSYIFTADQFNLFEYTKFIISWKNKDDFAATADYPTGSFVTDTSYYYKDDIDTLEFYPAVGYQVARGGYIKKFTYYPTRLTDNEIKDLTEE